MWEAFWGAVATNLAEKLVSHLWDHYEEMLTAATTGVELE